MFDALDRWLPWRKNTEERSIPSIEWDTALSGMNWGRVSEELALTYAPVWQAVKIISGDVSSLPLIIQERTGTTWEVNHTHPINNLLRMPDVEQRRGPVKFWRRLMAELLLWENAYVLITEDGLELLESGRMTFQKSSDGEFMYVYSQASSGGIESFFPDEIIHIEGLYLDRDTQTNPPFPIVLMRQMSQTLAIGKGSESYMDAFFRHGGRMGGILELPQSMSPKSKKNVEDGFRKLYETADSAFKTVVLRDNAKFHGSQASPQDAEMTEARESIAADVARWFNLPPHLLGLERQTSYNSLSEENKRYLQTLQYWLTAILDELNVKLLSKRQRHDYRFSYDVRTLQNGTMAELVTWGDTAIQGQMITRNEWRQIAGLPPAEGGDEFTSTRATNHDDSNVRDAASDDNADTGNEIGSSDED